MQITSNEMFEKFGEAFMCELQTIHEYVARIPHIEAHMIDTNDRLDSLENEVREHGFIIRNYGDQLDEHGEILKEHGIILKEHTKDLSWIKNQLATTST